MRGGLLMRQTHHWAAQVFIAAMMIHLVRVFVTGGFRKPREITWSIGALMLLLGTLEGFLGYSLPDDLLSGTGLRATDGFIKATPVVGSYLSMLLFGGEFPGDQVIPRFYIFHVLLIPGLILALMAFHLILIFFHKHTQWPGPGREERNVVGYPFLPVYVAKTTGFFFLVFGTLTLMGALVTINPLWKYGPYDPTKVTAGSQPDWYMGWPDGLLRLMPAWETELWGYTLSWNVIIPILVMPLLLWTVVLLLPFIEAKRTGDTAEHHLLQRPRDVPDRTALMAALITFYGLAWSAGGNDIIATQLHLSINQITYILRVAVLRRTTHRVLGHPSLVPLTPTSRPGAAGARPRDRRHRPLHRRWLLRDTRPAQCARRPGGGFRGRGRRTQRRSRGFGRDRRAERYRCHAQANQLVSGPRPQRPKERPMTHLWRRKQ